MNNIAKARRRKMLTQEQLAGLVDVSQKSVSKWELGASRPGQELLGKLCDVLECTSDYLLGYDQRFNATLPDFLYSIEPINTDISVGVTDDSMSPLYLAGDVVYIREQTDVQDGEIAAVIHDSKISLRRVFHTETGLILAAENVAKYAPLTISDGSAKIIGRAIGFTRIHNSKGENQK